MEVENDAFICGQSFYLRLGKHVGLEFTGVDSCEVDIRMFSSQYLNRAGFTGNIARLIGGSKGR
jgi:hypothetical protein